LNYGGLVTMVKTSEALLFSLISAIIIGIIYIVANLIFWNPALFQSNIKIVGWITFIAVFVTAFVGMKWKDW